MKTVQELNNTMADEKVYHIHICDKACILCGFHTDEKNASGQTVHIFCQKDWAEYNRKLSQELKDKCSICGNKRKFVKGTNVCKKCLGSSF